MAVVAEELCMGCFKLVQREGCQCPYDLRLFRALVDGVFDRVIALDDE